LRPLEVVVLPAKPHERLVTFAIDGVPHRFTQREWARVQDMARSSAPIDFKQGCVAWAAEFIRREANRAETQNETD
jgi:hypothetical protein